MADNTPTTETEPEKDPIDWGRMVANGFALAAGSALFSGILWAGKTLIKRSRERRLEREQEESESYA